MRNLSAPATPSEPVRHHTLPLLPPSHIAPPTGAGDGGRGEEENFANLVSLEPPMYLSVVSPASGQHCIYYRMCVYCMCVENWLYIVCVCVRERGGIESEIVLISWLVLFPVCNCACLLLQLKIHSQNVSFRACFCECYCISDFFNPCVHFSLCPHNRPPLPLPLHTLPQITTHLPQSTLAHTNSTSPPLSAAILESAVSECRLSFSLHGELESDA